MTIEPIEIGELPFYNADVEAEGDPPSVVTFKAALRQANGILIATPEYNDGIPAALTNAIDWGSRLPGRSPLIGKPVAVMGASPSQIGTARAQLHLRQLLGHVQARVLPPPEFLVARAHERFDAGLRLKDEGGYAPGARGSTGAIQPMDREGACGCGGGAGAGDESARLKHTQRRSMLSLATGFTDEDLVAWEERNAIGRFRQPTTASSYFATATNRAPVNRPSAPVSGA